MPALHMENTNPSVPISRRHPRCLTGMRPRCPERSLSLPKPIPGQPERCPGPEPAPGAEPAPAPRPAGCPRMLLRLHRTARSAPCPKPQPAGDAPRSKDPNGRDHPETTARTTPRPRSAARRRRLRSPRRCGRFSGRWDAGFSPGGSPPSPRPALLPLPHPRSAILRRSPRPGATGGTPAPQTRPGEGRTSPAYLAARPSSCTAPAAAAAAGAGAGLLRPC